MEKPKGITMVGRFMEIVNIAWYQGAFFLQTDKLEHVAQLCMHGTRSTSGKFRKLYHTLLYESQTYSDAHIYHTNGIYTVADVWFVFGFAEERRAKWKQRSIE